MNQSCSKLWALGRAERKWPLPLGGALPGRATWTAGLEAVLEDPGLKPKPGADIAVTAASQEERWKIAELERLKKERLEIEAGNSKANAADQWLESHAR